MEFITASSSKKSSFIDLVILDFPRSLYIQYSSDILWFKGVLRDTFASAGHIHKMVFHKIFKTEEEGKRYYGDVKHYQLFIRFNSLKVPVEELKAFKCKIRTFVDYQYSDFTFHFQPFKNLDVDDVCLFNEKRCKK